MSEPQAFIDDLARVGVAVESPWDLVNTRQPYPAAIPVLLDWLNRVDTEVPADDRRRFREALVRALTVRAARRVAAPALIREFHRVDASPGLRWAVGNSLETVADDSVFDELVALTQNQSYGSARQMVVLALGRMKDPRAVDVLIGLLNDDDVTGHAVAALGRLRAPQARPALEPFLDHPRPWVRKEAKKALARLPE